MLFKNIFFILFFLLVANCKTSKLQVYKPNTISENNFVNKGFALVYNKNLYKKKLISKKIDERSLTIFQKKLKTNTYVKITNILNDKSLIVKVGSNSDYPSFYNSVLPIRVSDELDLDITQPYVEIKEILESSTFIAKKAKTYDEEKNVAKKAPVKNIIINDLNKSPSNKKKTPKKKFTYNIKIADFYFNDTALTMVDRIITETAIKDPKIIKITEEKYRVFLGPFININSLQKSYNDISILEFENIEIIRND